MASVNKCFLVGHLGADPEIRYLPSGDPIANIRVATTDTYKDKQSGERKETTEWHRLVLFNRLAEIAEQYLKKGAQVYIEGRLRTRKWTDQDGVERYSTEIVVGELKMLGKRDDSRHDDGDHQPTAHQERRPPQSQPQREFDDLGDSDIPF